MIGPAQTYRYPLRLSRGRVGYVLAGVAGMLAAGCGLNRQGSDEVAAAWDRHQSSRAALARDYAGPAEPAPATGDAPDSATLSGLRDSIVFALENNPDILRAEAAARAKAARVPQATAPPDPMLMTKTLPEPVRTAEGDNVFVLGVTFKLPLPEKLDRAGRVALEEARMAISEWEQTRLRVIGDVKRAYFQLYALDRTVEITRDNQDLLRGLVEAARGQVAAGTRRQEDVLRAQVELSSLEARLIELHQQRITAEAMLNQLLNRDPTTPVPSPERFDVRKVDARIEDLFARAGEVNPELERMRRQIDRDREALALARLAWWPDLNVGFEWMLMQPRDAFRPPINPQTGKRPAFSRMSEMGTDNWAIIFGFNVPIWYEKIEGGIREARQKLSASMYDYTAARNMVQFRIADALARVRAQQELADLFDSTIVPQARQTFEVSREGYVVGKSDFQFVIDNWQKWLMFTVQYHRAIGELERSVADLEQAVGSSLAQSEGAP